MKSRLPIIKKCKRTHVIYAVLAAAFVAAVLQITTFQYKYNLLFQSTQTSTKQDDSDLPTRQTASSKTAKTAIGRDASILDQSPPTPLAEERFSPSNDDLNGQGEQLLSTTGKQQTRIAAPSDLRAPISSSTNQLSQTISAEDKLASRILNGEESLLSMDNQEVKFSPGKLLNFETMDVLRHCYVNTTIYENHFQLPGTQRRTMSQSDEFQLIYLPLPKSGSSTSRLLMTSRFGASEQRIEYRNDFFKRDDFSNYTIFTFVRDPLSRFFSSYEEAFWRSGPWRTNKNKKNKAFSHPVPYLFEGMKTLDDYLDIYCPPETRNGTRKLCDYQPTQENGTLAERFERYVRETDGRSPFDEHLFLQTPMLSNRDTGLPYPLNKIYTATTEGWEIIGRSRGVNLSAPIQVQTPHRGNQTIVGVIQGRSAPRRFDMNRISNATKQRICEFGLLDYCCLNMPLPSPCEKLHCRLKQINDANGRRLQIEPWSFPSLQATNDDVLMAVERFVRVANKVAGNVSLHTRDTNVSTFLERSAMGEATAATPKLAEATPEKTENNSHGSPIIDQSWQLPLDAKLASSILTGKESLPPGSETKDIKFSPGSLILEATQVLQHCHVNTTVYSKHLEDVVAKVSISEEHKLIFKFLRKSGSSTGRFLLTSRFGATDQFINNQNLVTPRWENYTVLTFVRDPLDRFFSSYDEAVLRTGPWQTELWADNNYSHPVPHLFEGIRTLDDYRDIYCPNWKEIGFIACRDLPTRENGTLAARLERYVRETDGLSPFDSHLFLRKFLNEWQRPKEEYDTLLYLIFVSVSIKETAMLSSQITGLPFRIDRIYNVASATEAWESIAKSKGVNLSKPIIKSTYKFGFQTSVGVIHARSKARRVDMSLISNATKQRICEFALLDYCCLNMPLPPPCENLYCRLKHVNYDSLGKRWQIEPWSFPTLPAAQ